MSNYIVYAEFVACQEFTDKLDSVIQRFCPEYVQLGKHAWLISMNTPVTPLYERLLKIGTSLQDMVIIPIDVRKITAHVSPKVREYIELMRTIH